MTLDFAQVGGHVAAMSAYLRASQPLRHRRLAQARRFLVDVSDAWESLAEDARRSSMSGAAPLEPLAIVHPCPPIPASYEVLATDGSTIAPDRHGPAMCAIINIGSVRIRYGPEPAAELRSEPRLLYTTDDLYVRQGDRLVLLGEQVLDARRSVDEMTTLWALTEERREPVVPQVALADGLLTVWRQDWAAADTDQVTEQFTAALDGIRGRGLPLGAYVSSPHSHWIVDLLRVHGRCRASGTSGCTLGCSQPDCAFDGLLDVELMDHLAPGDRSGIFEVVGRDANRYGEDNRTHFFYLNVGRELARVEIPTWVAKQPAAVDLMHAVVCDQAERGLGYPVALARAHEQAVVRGADRRAFRQMMVDALVRADIPVAPSEKQASKTMRAV